MWNKKSSNPNPTSILSEKEMQLNSYVAESEKAVSLITNTIDRLEAVNNRIEATRQEIETHRAELARLDGSMGEQYDHNAKIIDKFKAFLED